jgi:hypothetical protein
VAGEAGGAFLAAYSGSQDSEHDEQGHECDDHGER